MDVDRRGFIKYGVVGVGAAALLGSGVGMSSARPVPEADTGHGGSVKPPGKEAYIAERSLSSWMERFGLPLHIYSADVITRNVRAFRKVFEDLYPKGHVRFAAKACAHPAVFRIVLKEGAGIDVASYYETRCALEAGAPPGVLDLNGNCKEDFLIARAIEADMLIVADNIEEFLIVSGMAKKMGKSPRVVMRLSGFELGHVTA